MALDGKVQRNVIFIWVYKSIYKCINTLPSLFLSHCPTPPNPPLFFIAFHSYKSRDFMAGTNYNEKPPINMNWSVLWTKIIMLFCFLFCAVYFLLSTLAIFCPFYLHISIRVSDGKVFRFYRKCFWDGKSSGSWYRKTYSTLGWHMKSVCVCALCV